MSALRTIAFLSFAVLSCITAEPANDTAGTTTNSETTESEDEKPAMTAAAFRILDRGAYGMAARGDSLDERESSVHVASSAAEFNRLWQALVGEGAAPGVDFSKESAVFLMLGIRSSGGYGIEPSRAELEGTGAIVHAKRISPGKGDMTTQAITAPYVVIAIEKPMLTGVEWRDETGEVVALDRQQ